MYLLRFKPCCTLDVSYNRLVNQFTLTLYTHDYIYKIMVLECQTTSIHRLANHPTQ